jgi:hypothetical protein
MCKNLDECIENFYCYFKQECIKNKLQKEGKSIPKIGDPIYSAQSADD